MKRVLLTGADGFAGRYLAAELGAHGYEVIGLLRERLADDATLPACHEIHYADLDDPDGLRRVAATCAADAVVHLAAISFVAHGSVEAIYRTNLIGTHHLLEALHGAPRVPEAVILASSANVYGNAAVPVLDESVPVAPANDYAVSKVAMEQMARLWLDRLPITVVRPFNFIGIGQAASFVLPKIVDHCKRRAPVIELGNLDVERDFSDVRTVAEVYRRLLEKPAPGRTFNICSGRAYGLREILQMVSELTGWTPQVHVNPAFVRPNEVKRLMGSKALLESHIGPVDGPDLRSTLAWMLT
ncbi:MULTISPECIES: NAD-dependent epimerase/dehydratase family protein [unclassified Rubrivivax]|uniref:NAD-dependent epimerase/dehydratase family protein n=1 Tax=unclassified Rubrivivax TaxID=2649762 RepID=UPI001E458F25|nr:MULTISPECIES: NAD-dependent epimerase/dehydratase family protein [unclassified Rubrivivax]MCC9595495.1 NAD-dependent epimerase/dehydratase family protein [Rubrivivax sp. JA1055]MCC9646998.1 NAD-dependent epimerase/dehydratase family protein [Rubrivivax sp. JA1029]